MKKTLSILIIVSMLFSVLSISSFAVDVTDDGIVRVGLAFGTDARVAVNAFAENGYRIGYFDASDVFHELFNIDNRFVSFAKDKNLTIENNTVSESDACTIKAYHLQIGGFTTLAELNAALDGIKDKVDGMQAFPAYLENCYYIRIGSFATQSLAAEKTQQISNATGFDVSVAGNSDTGITVIDMNTAKIICELDFSDRYPAAFPRNAADGSELLIKNSTTYYKGAFEFKRFSGGNINFINVVRMDDYLAGVLAGEMNYSWPLEALKAQAVCARGYYVMNANKHSKYGFGVCATDDCQVYKGTANVKERIIQAVSETSGVIVTYNGNPITTLFMSSSGGYTESNLNVWGTAALPYYTPVEDIYSTTSPWTSTVTNAELTEYLQGKGYNIGSIVNFYISERTVPADNVYAVTFVDSTGKKLTIKKCDSVRIALSRYVKSPRFSVVSGSIADIYVNNSETKLAGGSSVSVIGADGTVQTTTANISLIDNSGIAQSLATAGTGTYTITGTGWGHNVGMSQYGAKAMAEKGYDYKAILKFYYTGTDVTYYSELQKQFEIVPLS